MLALLICGCAPLATFRLSEDVEMEVYSMTADSTSYEAKVKFVEHTPFHEVIQEGQMDQDQRFVEKFKSCPNTGTDTHCTNGLDPLQSDSRVMTVYVGNTYGTKELSSGFAMLPANRDGSVITNTSLFFNKKYRDSFPELTGEIIARSLIEGRWMLSWVAGTLTITTPSGKISVRNGVITKE